MQSPSTPATEILRRIEHLDDAAAGELLPLVYEELRRVAASFMRREDALHTLQATALVHEAWCKLIQSPARSFRGRAHFLSVASRAMRQVLIEQARRRGALKRGGNRLRVTLHEGSASTEVALEDLLSLHEALNALAAVDRRLARVVELRSFGGLTIDEAAEVLGVSHTTVEDDWALAQAWLARRLRDLSA